MIQARNALIRAESSISKTALKSNWPTRLQNRFIHANTRKVTHKPHFHAGTRAFSSTHQKWSLTSQSVDSQENIDKALEMVRCQHTSLDKYIAMAQLRNTDTRLFYKLINDHIEELAPVIYTPTVGEACLKYSKIQPYLNPPEKPNGLCITLDDLQRLDEMFEAYRMRLGQTPDITVMTDGSRILGLGDLGINGMPISVGKLQLYVAGAGVHPERTLPIVLDFGTNNQDYLTDKHYLGKRNTRPNDATFYDAVGQVLAALRRVFPDIVVQFEDFSSAHAFGLLKRHRSQLSCFNDDVQGTGVVVLAGLINAFRKVAENSKVKSRDHRMVFFGAGSAAIGVAKQIQTYLETEHGLSEHEAKDRIYLCDSKGLITLDRGDTLADHKVYYARKDNQGHQYKTLEDIVRHAQPTVLLGFSSIANAFNNKVLSLMHQINKQPIIFPLSNPATKAECSFEDAMKATNNSAIFASGTAFPSYTIPQTQEKRIPGQGNNMYVFPGLGLGSILSKTKSVSDDMLSNAAKALADSLTAEEIERGLIYPSLTRIREVSSVVATAVVEQAVKEKLAKNEQLPLDQIKPFVDAHMWSPEEKKNL